MGAGLRCDAVACCPACIGALQVVTLEVLHGKPHVIPLLEYGVTSAISGTRQWVLVFPRYASSLREWRTKWAGKGLHTQDLPVYLSLFLQVRGSGCTMNAGMLGGKAALTCT